jgi:AraC-like DNA-binding protein
MEAHVPPDVLRPFIKRYTIIEFTAPVRDSHVPDLALSAALHFQGPRTLHDSGGTPDAALTGMFDRTRNHVHFPGSGLALVTFTPAGASALLRVPASELRNRTEGISDIVVRPSPWRELTERLAGSGSNAQRFECLNRFFLTLVPDTEIDPLSLQAAEFIENSEGRIAIARLASHFSLSESGFLRRFRKNVGISPRGFATIARLRHVLRIAGTEPDLTSLAMAAGYFDQAHFIHDFKSMTGLTPGAYFELGKT